MQNLPKDIQNIIFEYYPEYHMKYCELTRIFNDLLYIKIACKPSIMYKESRNYNNICSSDDDDNMIYRNDIFDRSRNLFKRFNFGLNFEDVFQRYHLYLEENLDNEE